MFITTWYVCFCLLSPSIKYWYMLAPRRQKYSINICWVNTTINQSILNCLKYFFFLSSEIINSVQRYIILESCLSFQSLISGRNTGSQICICIQKVSTKFPNIIFIIFASKGMFIHAWIMQQSAELVNINSSLNERVNFSFKGYLEGSITIPCFIFLSNQSHNKVHYHFSYYKFVYKN